MFYGRRNLTFFGNLAEKASCVDDKTVLFRYTKFMNCFSVICLKSVSQRDTAVSSPKRPKSVLDTDNPYQVACLMFSGFQKCENGRCMQCVISVIIKCIHVKSPGIAGRLPEFSQIPRPPGRENESPGFSYQIEIFFFFLKSG